MCVCVCVLTSAEDQSGTHRLCLADINTDREEHRLHVVQLFTAEGHSFGCVTRDVPSKPRRSGALQHKATRDK